MSAGHIHRYKIDAKGTYRGCLNFEGMTDAIHRIIHDSKLFPSDVLTAPIIPELIRNLSVSYEAETDLVFALFDSDHDGRISRIDFANLVTFIFGSLPSLARVNTVWRSSLSSDGAPISRVEYISWLRKGPAQRVSGNRRPATSPTYRSLVDRLRSTVANKNNQSVLDAFIVLRRGVVPHEFKPRWYQ